MEAEAAWMEGGMAAGMQGGDGGGTHGAASSCELLVALS